jgi:hypothetical protein
MPKSKSGGFFRNNGLSLVFGALFLISLGAQSYSGWHVYNQEQSEHEESRISYPAYLVNAHFWQAVGENWESEFLQMGTYVLFTVFLFQLGSAESKDPEGEEDVDKEPARGHVPKDAPWPVRAGGLALGVYRYSLSLAFLALFLVSMVLHALAGVRKHNAEELAHGQPAESLLGYATSSEFWFESMQNWQSEFLAVLAMVYLSIYLRQKGSPESKPLAAAHSDTGR